MSTACPQNIEIRKEGGEIAGDVTEAEFRIQRSELR